MHLCSHRCRLLQTSPPCGWTVRSVLAVLAALLYTADVILVILLQQADMYLDVLADSCAVLGWLVHFSAIMVLQRSAFRRTRGPLLLALLVLLSVPNVIITYIDCRHPITFFDLLFANFKVNRSDVAFCKLN